MKKKKIVIILLSILGVIGVGVGLLYYAYLNDGEWHKKHNTKSGVEQMRDAMTIYK